MSRDKQYDHHGYSSHGGTCDADGDESSSDCTDSSDYERCCKGDPEQEEIDHFLDVCYSFLDYQRYAQYDISHYQETMAALDPADRELWPCRSKEWLDSIVQRVQVNQRFLTQMPSPAVCSADLGPDAEQRVSQIPAGVRVSSKNSSKVRTTLRQFVRDWAVEGQAERAMSYGPLISALRKYLPPRYKGPKGDMVATTVLCPGCGLGRLPFDLACAGYAAQGNEFSYHMLLGCHVVLNRSPAAGCHVIYPFVLSTTNRFRAFDHLIAIRVPDICPGETMPMDAQLSMAAGEFVEVYKDQHASWDAILTCFFLDTAKNVLLYIRIIADIVREGGYWINIGPLLWHYADLEHEISIELSWEEIKPCICRYFDIVEEEQRTSTYTTNPGSLQGAKYNCVFFVAKRNSEPAVGTSNPVF